MAATLSVSMVSLVFVYVVRHHEGGRFLVWPVLELTHLIFDLALPNGVFVGSFSSHAVVTWGY